MQETIEKTRAKRAAVDTESQGTHHKRRLRVPCRCAPGAADKAGGARHKQHRLRTGCSRCAAGNGGSEGTLLVDLCPGPWKRAALHDEETRLSPMHRKMLRVAVGVLTKQMYQRPRTASETASEKQHALRQLFGQAGVHVPGTRAPSSWRSQRRRRMSALGFGPDGRGEAQEGGRTPLHPTGGNRTLHPELWPQEPISPEPAPGADPEVASPGDQAQAAQRRSASTPPTVTLRPGTAMAAVSCQNQALCKTPDRLFSAGGWHTQ